jgi:cytochrome c2
MDLKPMTMEQRGAATFDKLACGNCHSNKDTDRAPTLYGFFGKTRKFTDGSATVADEAYFRKSLIDPYEKINQGYTNTMQAYNDLSEEEILNMIAYVKSLGTSTQPKSGATVAPHTGVEQTASNQGNNELAVGALAGEKVVAPGPKGTNLSVGALSTEGGAHR